MSTGENESPGLSKGNGERDFGRRRSPRDGDSRTQVEREKGIMRRSLGRNNKSLVPSLMNYNLYCGCS